MKVIDERPKAPLGSLTAGDVIVKEDGAGVKYYYKVVHNNIKMGRGYTYEGYRVINLNLNCTVADSYFDLEEVRTEFCIGYEDYTFIEIIKSEDVIIVIK